MILLVLILTLELITRMNQKGVAEDHSAIARQLQDSIEDLRDRLRELREQASRGQETARRVAGQSLKQMDAERRKAQRERDALTARIASLGVAAREARLERRDAESDLVQMEKKETESSRHRSQAAKDMAAAKVLEENNKKEQDRQEKVEKDLKESPSVASTLVFNPPKGQLL